MSSKTRLSALKSEYQKLWDSAEIDPAFVSRIDTVIERIVQPEARKQYEQVEAELSIPWWWVAAIHNLECSGNFNLHLHNGDPLTARTVRVPAGRPTAPPENGSSYTWMESALDALTEKGFDDVSDRSLIAWLWRAELFNGMGYRLYHPEVLTPYLWSGTNHYKVGKYSKDGKFDPNLKSEQVGLVAIAKRLLATAPNSSPAVANQEQSGFIEAIAPTVFKQSTRQNSSLSSGNKSSVPVGTRLPIWKVEDCGGHYKVSLKGVELTADDGETKRLTWYAWKDHVKLIDIAVSAIAYNPTSPLDKLALKVVEFCDNPTNGDSPYPLSRGEGEINLIGIEGMNLDTTLNNDAADKWNDLIGILTFDSAGHPHFEAVYRCTTEPGYHYTIKRLLNPNGAARLQLGYQKGLWQIGIHKGYEALVQGDNPARLVRDRNRNFLRDDATTVEYWRGINCHSTSSRNNFSWASIGLWSAGCTVIPVWSEFQAFLRRVKQSKQYKENRGHDFDFFLLWSRWLT